MNEILLFAEIAFPHDFQSTLIWVIFSLVTILGIIWKLYVSAINRINENSQTQLEEIKKLMESRMEEKQELIKELLEKVERVQAEKEKMINEINPAFQIMNQTLENVLQFLRDAKHS
jgi:predicted PurR-regulated permease PerM